ncbi:MAG: hypothetical protein Q9196_005061 [Gyalolechia fulgens]
MAPEVVARLKNTTITWPEIRHRTFNVSSSKEVKTPTVKILFDVPPAECATSGRFQSWSADQIRTTITQFAQHYIPELHGKYSLASPQLDSASAGIDPAIPPTFAFGCDATKSKLWTPMLNDMADATDIVVMNLDDLANEVVFCGVMTKAHKPATSSYQICNAPK